MDGDGHLPGPVRARRDVHVCWERHPDQQQLRALVRRQGQRHRAGPRLAVARRLPDARGRDLGGDHAARRAVAAVTSSATLGSAMPVLSRSATCRTFRPSVVLMGSPAYMASRAAATSACSANASKPSQAASSILFLERSSRIPSSSHELVLNRHPSEANRSAIVLDAVVSRWPIRARHASVAMILVMASEEPRRKLEET